MQETKECWMELLFVNELYIKNATREDTRGSWECGKTKPLRSYSEAEKL